MNTVIYWFRNDLRLADNPALIQACNNATHVLPVYCHAPAANTRTTWGFDRVGKHRRHFLATTLTALDTSLRKRGSGLAILHGAPEVVLPALVQRTGAASIMCEAIAAPEEENEIAALRVNGIKVDTHWQSSLLDPAVLPFAMDRLPDLFTTFRHAVEKAGVVPAMPLATPHLPPLPPLPPLQPTVIDAERAGSTVSDDAAWIEPDSRSSFPYHSAAFSGGEAAGLAHLDQYFSRHLAHTYKATRNGLNGIDYSSKFSPWLASGALSARTAYAALKHFEAQSGASDSTYWLWFELLWRDYFRFLHLKYGRRLYRAGRLSDTPPPSHDPLAFSRWCNGETGEPLIDAGMRELQATGYLSNRLRQNAASYLVHDLKCDWRAGAAWFESQLVDYDVYSNQGNWLYVAGRGTDPRSGRRFNPRKQALDYDADGRYRSLWGLGAQN